MTCAPIVSGERFLNSSIYWLDCAGRALGENGYRALASPQSTVSNILLAFLTLFIAIQGLRLMFNRSLDMGDAALAAAKVGLMLMLATSWAATRTLAFDTVVRGPGELVGQIMAEPTPLVQRLQQIDNDIVTLTSWGSGKLDVRAGRTAGDKPASAAFTGAPVQGGLALGSARLIFLVGSLASLGMMSLGGGILIALLPLFAGLLLFDLTRGVFVGWARSMLFILIAGAAARIVLSIETSLLGPWLVRVIQERQSDFATPSAPIELLAITLAFAIVVTGTLILIGRVVFTIDPQTIVRLAKGSRRDNLQYTQDIVTPVFAASTTTIPGQDRAAHLGSIIEMSSRREQRIASANQSVIATRRDDPASVTEIAIFGSERSAHRRTIQRSSLSNTARDRQ